MSVLINPGRSPSALMQQMRLGVEAEGALVKLTVGNSTITMGYETALQLSQWLRVRGKQAKKNAGDVSQHWSAVGILEGLKN